MDRRALLTLGTGLAVSVLTGYTPAIMATDKHKGPAGLLFADMEPDGLTKTYRKYRLLIIGQRDDGKATAIANRWSMFWRAFYLPRAPGWSVLKTRGVSACSSAHINRILVS